MAVFQWWGMFAPASRWLYDHAAHIAYEYRWAAQAQQAGVYQQRPALIAIDESSLQAVGRWPWSRKVHASLLDRLNQPGGAPSVLALDIVFAEPQLEGVDSVAKDEDAALAQAINRSVFPVLLATQLEKSNNQYRLIQPKRPLSSSAARLSHVQIDADIDGSVRQYWPLDDSFPGIVLPYLGKAMAAPLSAPSILSTSQLVPSSPVQYSASDAQQAELLYPLPIGWVQVLSYQAVLSGELRAQAWAGVPTLVAATAKGLGDQYVSHLYNPSSVISGGELVLGAFHTEKLLQAGLPHLKNAALPWQALCTVVLVVLVFFGLRRSASVSRQLAVLAGALVLVWACSLLLLALGGVWLNSAALGFAAVLTWVLWVSHTLRRLLAYLLRRLQQTGVDTSIGQTVSAAQTAASLSPAAPAGQDVIEQQLWTVDALEARRQAEFTRLSQVLELLPDAAFVLNREQPDSAQLHLSFQNRAARQLVQRFPSMHLAAQSSALSLNGLLSGFIADLTEQQQAALQTLAGRSFEWQHLFEFRAVAAFEQGVESNAPQNERFLIKLAQLTDLSSQPGASSVVLSVVDLSVSLALDEARDRTFNFLSHDLRAPQTTILALLELEGLSSSNPHQALFDKIQFQAQRTLQLAEGFVQLSQASHSTSYQLVEYNLNDLMIEALDEQWASAKQKNITLKGEPCDELVWVALDRNLMWRALVNLITNALNACKLAPQPHSQIQVSVRREGLFGVIQIADNGSGIDPARHASLFQPFVQGQGLKRTGAGLGLAFVKTVMDQHHGQVRVHSPVFESPAPHGTRFELWLPLLPDEPESLDQNPG